MAVYLDILATDHPLGDFAAGDIVLLEQRRRDLFRQIAQWQADGWTVRIVCANEGEATRLRELAASGETTPRELPVLFGTLTRGFTLPEAKLALLTDAELFGRAASLEQRRGGWARRFGRSTSHPSAAPAPSKARRCRLL